MIYNEIDGLKYVMEKKELEKLANQFPPHIPNGARSYAQIFCDIEEMMNRQVHQYVTTGAASAGDGMLNDHGVDHVRMVQERAYMLIKDKCNDLTGYEIFFLLLAIHFHDVGNLLGRDAHEEKIDEVFEALGDKFPLDNVAQRLIRDIAMSHGGNVQGDKDTISYVQDQVYVDGVCIRASLLASILRYADEIADDKNRASAFLLRVGSVPMQNRVFHEYSRALEPPVINGDTLNLQYYIANEFIDKKITKNNTEVYLYDEILLRIKKCLCELEYCRKYSQGFIRIFCISVSIAVLDEKGRKVIYQEAFKLRLGGYPDPALYTVDKWCSIPAIRATSAIELMNILGKGEKEQC